MRRNYFQTGTTWGNVQRQMQSELSILLPTVGSRSPSDEFLLNFKGQCLKKIILKVKLSVCFSWAPHYVDVLGEWRYSPAHSWPRQ